MDLLRLASCTVHRPEDAAAPVVFAAGELAAYLRRMLGGAPVVRPHRGPRGAWLCLTPSGVQPPAIDVDVPEGAEWAVRPSAGGVVVAGASPRALLAAVYALLEGAGCRWSPHGPSDERVPAGAAVEASLRPMTGRAAFGRRVWASDLSTWHYSMPARLAERLPSDIAFVDWMAKTGATGLFFIRAANDTQWVVPGLVPELARRGLDVEGGGHAVVELLPRDLFGRHPEWFPVGSDGRRTDYGNVCASSSDAIAVVCERARGMRRDVPGTAALHVWGLDVLDGGWCRCDACARLAPSDQSLVVCNAVADALGDGTTIHHLAYHDTLRPPRAISPHPRVRAEFAPRERCYAHALDDPSCARNAAYREAFERHLEAFDGRVDVFEYYADAILFAGCAVPLVEVVERDLAYYASTGTPGVSCLTFGDFSLWAYGANVSAFARGVLDPAAASAAVDAWCRTRYGPSAEPLRRYLTTLERVVRPAVSHGDVALPPRRADRATAVHRALGRALAETPALRALLADAAALAPAATRDRIAAEERLLDYTVATLATVRDWLAARLGDDAAGTEAAVAALIDGVAHLRRVPTRTAGTWAAYDLEITLAFFAAGLRAAPDDHDPFA